MADLFRSELIYGDGVFEVARAGMRGAAQKTAFGEVLSIYTGVRYAAQDGETFPVPGE